MEILERDLEELIFEECMIGPVYIIGSPSKQIAEGKSIMAKKELLKSE